MLLKKKRKQDDDLPDDRSNDTPGISSGYASCAEAVPCGIDGTDSSVLKSLPDQRVASIHEARVSKRVSMLFLDRGFLQDDMNTYPAYTTAG